jgi:hypothetical protein
MASSLSFCYSIKIGISTCSIPPGHDPKGASSGQPAGQGLFRMVFFLLKGKMTTEKLDFVIKTIYDESHTSFVEYVHGLTEIRRMTIISSLMKENAETANNDQVKKSILCCYLLAKYGNIMKTLDGKINYAQTIHNLMIIHHGWGLLLPSTKFIDDSQTSAYETMSSNYIKFIETVNPHDNNLVFFKKTIDNFKSYTTVIKMRDDSSTIYNCVNEHIYRPSFFSTDGQAGSSIRVFAAIKKDGEKYELIIFPYTTDDFTNYKPCRIDNLKSYEEVTQSAGALLRNHEPQIAQGSRKSRN